MARVTACASCPGRARYRARCAAAVAVPDRPRGRGRGHSRASRRTERKKLRHTHTQNASHPYSRSDGALFEAVLSSGHAAVGQGLWAWGRLEGARDCPPGTAGISSASTRHLVGIYCLLSQRALCYRYHTRHVSCCAFHLLVTVAALDADLAWVCCPRVGEHSHAGTAVTCCYAL